MKRPDTWSPVEWEDRKWKESIFLGLVMTVAMLLLVVLTSSLFHLEASDPEGAPLSASLFYLACFWTVSTFLIRHTIGRWAE